MAAMVREVVENGEFASSSEVIRDALRDWKTKRVLAQLQIDELRRLVAESHVSGTGPWQAADATLTEIRRRSDASQKA
jgi:antitoxin ParD1/3/4